MGGGGGARGRQQAGVEGDPETLGGNLSLYRILLE